MPRIPTKRGAHAADEAEAAAGTGSADWQPLWGPSRRQHARRVGCADQHGPGRMGWCAVRPCRQGNRRGGGQLDNPRFQGLEISPMRMVRHMPAQEPGLLWGWRCADKSQTASCGLWSHIAPRGSGPLVTSQQRASFPVTGPTKHGAADLFLAERRVTSWHVPRPRTLEGLAQTTTATHHQRLHNARNDASLL